MKTLRFLLSVTSACGAVILPLSFLSFPRRGRFVAGECPLLYLPHALDLKCRWTAIGIMQKLGTSAAHAKAATPTVGFYL